MYQPDWDILTEREVASQRRTSSILDWLKSAVKPIKTINALMGTFVSDTDERLAFTGQTVYLDHILNKKFDPAFDDTTYPTGGIYIEDLDIGYGSFLFRDYESVPVVQDTIINNTWDSGDTYALDDYISYTDGTFSRVYKSLQAANLNKNPASEPTWWEDVGLDPYIYNTSEVHGQFVVHVPVALYPGLPGPDAVFEGKISAWVNKYRQAGTTFTIVQIP